MEIIKGLNDSSLYKFVELPNKIKILLVSNQKLEFFTCVLNILTGLIHKNSIFPPGTPHLVEHLLMSSNKKYLEKNGMLKFAWRNKGTTNGMTCIGSSKYQISVNHTAADECLDRFANMLICPDFKKENVATEVAAIDNEFLGQRSTDQTKISFLSNHLMWNNTDLNHIFGGNKETLDLENIHEISKKFWKEEYSSDIMTMVIASNKSIEELEEKVKIFEQVPNNNLRESRKQEINEKLCLDIAYNTTEGKIVYYDPVNKNIKSFVISIWIPDPIENYCCNYLDYVIHKLQSKDSFSLYNSLLQKNLIDSYFCYYNGRTGNMQDFHLCFSLKDNSIETLNTIASYVYTYLKNFDFNKTDYDSYVNFLQHEFNKPKQSLTFEDAHKAAEAMQYIPPEKTLNYQCSSREYDQDKFNKLRENMTKLKNWIFFASNDQKNLTEIIEVINAKYILEPFIQPHIIPDLVFKRSVSLVPVPRPKPIELDCNTIIETKKFNYGIINFLYNKDIDSSLASITITLEFTGTSYDILVQKLACRKCLTTFKNENTEVLISYDIYIYLEEAHNCTTFRFNGNPTKMIEVIQSFFKCLYSTSFDDFQSMKKAFFSINPAIGKDLIEIICLEAFKVKVVTQNGLFENVQYLNSLTNGERKFVNSYYTKIVGCGNIRLDDLKTLYRSIKSCNKRGSLDLPIRKDIVPVLSNDPINNCVIISFCTASMVEAKMLINKKTSEAINSLDHKLTRVVKISSSADEIFLYHRYMTQLLVDIFASEFFNDMRIVKQVGYTAQCKHIDLKQLSYLSFLVKSIKSTEIIKENIMNFINHMKNRLAQMTDEELAIYKKLISETFTDYNSSINGLKSFCDAQIYLDSFSLDFNDKRLDILNSITVQDLIELDSFEDYVLTFTFRRDEIN